MVPNLLYLNKKKICIIIIVLFIIMACIFYFKPLLLSSTVKNEALDYTKKMSFSVTTDKFQSEYCCYLDSDSVYDYYCMLEYEQWGSGVKNTYLLKLYDNKVMDKYDLSNLCGSVSYVQRGICNNNYLYFNIRGVDSIYRIDTNFKLCETYIEESQYGTISYTSLGIRDEGLLYITDNGNIVKYNNGKESLILTVPKLNDVFGGAGIEYNEFLAQYNYAGTTNYIVCSNDDRMFCAAKNKLFLYNDENGELKDMNLRLSEDAYIRKLCFSQENKNILFVFYTVQSAPWEATTNHLAVYNTKNGFTRKIEQEQEHQFREWKIPKNELSFGCTIGD